MATPAATYAGTGISATILAAVGLPAISTALRYIEQNWAIYRVAFNKCREDDLEMVQNGLDQDPAFQQLVFLWQKTLEQPWCCRCCRGGAEDAAIRLRVALRRVVTYKGKLPPIGPPLKQGDALPKAAHTPTYRRDVAEQMHLLQDPGFMSSALAIDLAKNIVKAAREEEEEAAAQAGLTRASGVGRSPGTRPGAPTTVDGETSSAHRTGVLSTRGGDIGPTGPEPTLSQRPILPSMTPEETIRLWLEKEEHLAQPFPPGPGTLQSTVSASTSARAGPAQVGAERAARTGRSSTSITREIEALPDSPGTVAMVQARTTALEVAPAPAQLPPLRTRPPQHEADGNRARGGSGSGTAVASVSEFAAPGSVSRSRAGSRAGTAPSLVDSVSEFAAPGTVSRSGTAAPRAASIVGSLDPANVPRSQRAAGAAASASESAGSTGTETRAHQQNFGKNPLERRKLIAAAYRNLRKNEEELPTDVSWPVSRRRPSRNPSGGGGSSGGDSPRPGRRMEGASRNLTRDDGSRPRRRGENGSPQPSHRGAEDSVRSERQTTGAPQTSRLSDAHRFERPTGGATQSTRERDSSRTSVGALRREKEEAIRERGGAAAVSPSRTPHQSPNRQFSRPIMSPPAPAPARRLRYEATSEIQPAPENPGSTCGSRPARQASNPIPIPSPSPPQTRGLATVTIPSAPQSLAPLAKITTQGPSPASASTSTPRPARSYKGPRGQNLPMPASTRPPAMTMSQPSTKVNSPPTDQPLRGPGIRIGNSSPPWTLNPQSAATHASPPSFFTRAPP